MVALYVCVLFIYFTAKEQSCFIVGKRVFRRLAKTFSGTLPYPLYLNLLPLRDDFRANFFFNNSPLQGPYRRKAI